MELLMARARFRAFPWIELRSLKEHDSHNSDSGTVECLFPSQFALDTGVPKEPRPVSLSWVWLELAGVFRIRPQPGQSVFCPGKAGSYFITERSRGRADLGLSLPVRSCSSFSFEMVSLCAALSWNLPVSHLGLQRAHRCEPPYFSLDLLLPSSKDGAHRSLVRLADPGLSCSVSSALT